jgi:hypothetical protein
MQNSKQSSVSLVACSGHLQWCGPGSPLVAGATVGGRDAIESLLDVLATTSPGELAAV